MSRRPHPPPASRAGAHGDGAVHRGRVVDASAPATLQRAPHGAHPPGDPHDGGAVPRQGHRDTVRPPIAIAWAPRYDELARVCMRWVVWMADVHGGCAVPRANNMIIRRKAA
eukprot:350800-Chlamydomonas_euryale.AAC.3